MRTAQPRDRAPPLRSSRPAATMGWLRHCGSWSRMPRSPSSSGAPDRLPEARIVQSLARSRCFSTYGSPSISSRSSTAPDLPGASATGSRFVADASSSASRSRWPRPPGSGTGSLHLSQQGSRPATTAEHRVRHDAIISHRQYVQVVTGVRDPVLLPAEGVLHDLRGAICDGVSAKLFEFRRVGEPAAVLTADRVGSAKCHTPVRHRRVKSCVDAPDVAVRDPAGGEKVVDYLRVCHRRLQSYWTWTQRCPRPLAVSLQQPQA